MNTSKTLQSKQFGPDFAAAERRPVPSSNSSSTRICSSNCSSSTHPNSILLQLLAPRNRLAEAVGYVGPQVQQMRRGQGL